MSIGLIKAVKEAIAILRISRYWAVRAGECKLTYAVADSGLDHGSGSGELKR